MRSQIRPATSADALNLAALSIQVWLHTYATSGIRRALSEFVLNEFTKARFEDLVALPDHDILVAEIEGHLVGYAHLDFDSPTDTVPHTRTELVTLYVQEHFLGRGLGSGLLEACDRRSHLRTGDSGCWLSVYWKNARAIRFYQNHGFTTVGDFDFELGEERHKNYILARVPTHWGSNGSGPETVPVRGTIPWEE